MYPTEVNFNAANLAKYLKTLERAYISIEKEIKTATNFGVANRKAILSQISAILTEHGVDLQKLLKNEVQNQYLAGANDAVGQLKNVGADIGVATSFNSIHKEAIAALVDDGATLIAESLTGVVRSATVLLGRATRDLLTQKLAEGIIGGKALQQVKKEIVLTLQDKGLSALKDKAGRNWQLDNYADMLFRTKAVEARNRGLANRMAENGYDLVQVSSHPGSCEQCAPWQGKILSLRGATEGYLTVDKAQSDGLFHPRCRHAINVLIPSLANRTKAYDTASKTYK